MYGFPPTCNQHVNVGEDERKSLVQYWTKGWNHHNFGDYLSELFVECAIDQPKVMADRYHLIGSVLNRETIEFDLQSLKFTNPTIAFWCCGARSGAPNISPDLWKQCSLFGVRGPLTRDVFGLSAQTPMGDPGLLLPLIYKPRVRAELVQKSICSVPGGWRKKLKILVWCLDCLNLILNGWRYEKPNSE